jgi:hypothetical protein
MGSPFAEGEWGFNLSSPIQQAKGNSIFKVPPPKKRLIKFKNPDQRREKKLSN